MESNELDFPAEVSPKSKARRLIKRGMRRVGVRVGFLRQYAAIPLQIPRPPVRHGVRNGSPIVSIVTPSLNQVPFLEATLRSVLDQDYPNLEYIIIDGGSTDGSADIIRAQQHRLAHWCSEPDRGQAHAINKGLARSTGSIMAWLNSDDLLLPGSIETVVRWFADHPNVDALYSHRIVIDQAGDEVGRWILPRHSASALRWRDYVPQETLFWRRSLWDRIGGKVNEEFQFAMDWELLLRFHRAGAKFARVPGFLGVFRTHPGQKTLAMVERVGRGEFDRLHADYGGPLPARFFHRLASSMYVARSVPHTWLYKWSLRKRDS